MDRSVRRGKVGSLACVLALTCAACHHSALPPDGGTQPQCATRVDCDAGLICTKDLYCANCSTTGECALRELCDPQKQLCVFRPGWGNQCQLNAQCQAGQWCSQGLCLDRANVQLCPDGVSSECPTGMRCNALNSVCETDLGCLTNDDCDPGEACNTGRHACVPACTTATQGQVCAANQKCNNSVCVQCSQTSDCGVGLVCDAAGNCGTGTRCYQDRDCQIPLVCYPLTGQCVPKLPPCNSDEDCGANQRCQIGTGKCIPSACQPDRLEPNNTPDSGFPVTVGQYQSLTLCNGETDYFSIGLNRGDDLGVDVNADPYSEASFTTFISDGNGRTLASGHLVASYVAPAQATYYVGVTSTDPSQSYDLILLLSRGTPCDDDVYEPNDTPQQAWPLNATTSVDATLCPGNPDYFSLPVPTGKGVTVSLQNYTSQSGLLQLCLSQGTTQLGCSEDLTTPSVSATATQVGGHSVVIEISGSTQQVRNTYTLQAVFQ